MDSREALQKNTKLRFCDGHEYTIIDELARGGASIVYNAFYKDNLGEKKTVRIKECYPFKCRLNRSADGSLIIPEAEERLFEDEKEKTLRAYRLESEFFRTDGLTNFTANAFNIFDANNTLYVVQAYVQGRELSYQSYSSVRDCIAVVKSVAETVKKLHDRGFLYLDIKPANILTLDGTTELIQMFDFDTVVPIADAGKSVSRISYTRGFAAPEQEMGDSQKTGRHTDVYAVGALLYYMLFGRTPDAFDCEPDAEYDFSKSKLSGSSCRDELAFRLSDFFHHTIANYYPDRFSNMETVVEKLSELCSLADAAAVYIYSSKISCTDLFFGREKETGWIEQRLKADSGCFFIVGMGGIGKSTLMRSCLRKNSDKIDTVLYLNYLGSLERTITDDYAAHINAVKKDKTEINAEYFTRKLSVLKELCKDKKCVLVIDNYTVDNSDALSKLIDTGWLVFLITRDRAAAFGKDVLEVGKLSNCSDLLRIFTANVGRELTDEEKFYAFKIIECTGGHTLAIELIAKQIASPVCRLSIKKAAEIAEKKGFSQIAPEKVSWQKDSNPRRDTIKNIIAALFEADNISSSQRTMIKTISLFGEYGVLADKLSDMLRLKTRDDLVALYNQGWIGIEDTVITMHPVIRETVSAWAYSESSLNAVRMVISYLEKKLRTQPDLRNLAKDGDAGRHKKNYCLLLTAAVLKTVNSEKNITSSDEYRNLLYCAVTKTPYEFEEYILEKSEEYIKLSPKCDEKRFLKVCECRLEILCQLGKFKDAFLLTDFVKKEISTVKDPFVLGEYYNFLTSYYDARLNGAYDADTDEERLCLKELLRCTDKAVKYMSRSHEQDAIHHLAQYSLSEALLLIRTCSSKKLKIRALLNKANKLMEIDKSTDYELMRDYAMTCAWYYTYLKPNINIVLAYLSRAEEMSNLSGASDMEKIDYFISPAANMLLELQLYDAAEGCLNLAVKICEKHISIPAYERKRVEMFNHLRDVYHDFELSLKYRKE